MIKIKERDDKVRKVNAKSSTSEPKKKLRPALTPEARENQLISLAMDRAEQQLMDGTASSQVITHFLKLGTAKYQFETEKLKHDTELVKAKTESLESAKNMEALYEKAIKSLQVYRGAQNEEDEDL